ncbi:MAG: hypothetical protein AAF642_18015 [Pseudomonadota bacterium]
MRAAFAIGALLLGSGVADAAPDPPVSFGPGSMLFWTSAQDGNADRFRETLLIEGDDFAIFQTKSDWTTGDETDYFALFSGIYYNTCDLEMPNSDERAALAALWPLTEGDTVEIATEQGATFEIGAATEFYLMGKRHAAHEISISYLGDDASEETAIVLDDVPMTVAVNWEGGGRDSATLVTRPKSVASTPVDTDLIGTCASLLNNQTDKN